jgi:hypothetical protein
MDDENLFNRNNETFIGSLMNTSHSNIGWMPIMSCGSLGSKTWSWPSNFMKIILDNVDDISII